MGRIRAHNRKAKRIGYALFARRRRQPQRVWRHALMYGMGTQGLRNLMAEVPRRYGKTCYLDLDVLQLPSRMDRAEQSARRTLIVGTNFAVQEHTALASHRASIVALRAQGYEVTEHSYADASVDMTKKVDQ